MKIACCTLEMIALIFLLFVSRNGGFTYLNEARADYAYASTTELVSAWGEPDAVVAANDLGFASAQVDAVEVWTYADLERSVVVRGDAVLSIQDG